MFNLIKERFIKLSGARKAVLIGAGISIVSVFMPWYSDIDRFRIGDKFLGITGPLYLTGLLVLLAGGLSFGLIMLYLTKKPLPNLPIKESQLHMLNGGASMFMVIIAASVYFHSKFGVNIADKSVGIGMYLAFLGGGVLVAGGIMSKKVAEVFTEKEAIFEEESAGSQEQLIEITDRQTQNIKSKEEMTLEDAIQVGQQRPDGKGWDQVQESINNYQKSVEEDTKDIK